MKSKNFLVAPVVCLICSLFVSSFAVYLKPIQLANKTKDLEKNILLAAGFKENDYDAFSKIKTAIVDLKNGDVVDNPKNEEIAIEPIQDIAGIKKHERFVKIYYVKEDDTLKKLILPIYGKGLWSTMYAFLTLGEDLNTVESIIFYEHGETPGLGGEIENPRWQEKWKGKKIYSENGDLKLEVIKGRVDLSSSHATYEVDGLSGATLTTKGVSNTVKYWLSENGFKVFLDKLKDQKIILR